MTGEGVRHLEMLDKCVAGVAETKLVWTREHFYIKKFLKYVYNIYAYVFYVCIIYVLYIFV